MTIAAASSCRFTWGILLFVVCSGHLSALVLPLVQGFQGLPPAAQARTHRGLFLALPTATAIDEVIATGDEDGAIAEVMTMTDVVPTKKFKMPLATSITEVLTTEGELSAVQKAQQPGRLRRIWRRVRGKTTMKTTTETETTTKNDDEDESNDVDRKRIGAGIRLNPDFIDRTSSTDETEATKKDTTNKPKFVGGQYTTKATNKKATNKNVESQEKAGGTKTTTEQKNGDDVEDDVDADDNTVAVTVEPNLEKKDRTETKTPIVAATTTTAVIDEKNKKKAKAALLQQQKQQQDKKDRAAATKRKQQDKAAAQAQRLAARRRITRQQIEAKAAAKAAARTTSNTNSNSETTTSFNVNEMEDETRNGLIVVALLGVLWLANL